MSTELQTFEFQSHQLTLIADENGELWFIAKEVAEILSYSAAEAMTRRLDDDEKLVRQFVVSGQNRDVLLINESGLYSSIIGSTKPEAKAFKKWVTSVVLPSIRKTGSYAVETQNLASLQNTVEMQKDFIAGYQQQINFLQAQLSQSQTVASGMQSIYQQEEDKVQRLLRARGTVKAQERRDIFAKLDDGMSVGEIAKWMYRSPAFVKAVIAAGRWAK